VSEINWYLTKTNNAIDKISKLTIPVNGDELRFQYSSLIESIFSTIDYVTDKNEIFCSAKNYIDKEIVKKLGSEGEIILAYMRELRNAVIHRGFDISVRGDVVQDRIALYTPTGVTDRNGKQKATPSETCLDVLLYNLDKAIKEVVLDELTKLGALTKGDSQKIARLGQAFSAISLPDNVPNHVRTMFEEWHKNLDGQTANQFASSIYNNSIDNLIENLSVTMDLSFLKQRP